MLHLVPRPSLFCPKLIMRCQSALLHLHALASCSATPCPRQSRIMGETSKPQWKVGPSSRKWFFSCILSQTCAAPFLHGPQMGSACWDAGQFNIPVLRVYDARRSVGKRLWEKEGSLQWLRCSQGYDGHCKTVYGMFQIFDSVSNWPECLIWADRNGKRTGEMLFNKQMNSFPVCSTRVYIQSLVHVKQALGTADLYPQLLFFLRQFHCV